MVEFFWNLVLRYWSYTKSGWEALRKGVLHIESGFISNLSSIERMPVFLPVSGNHRKIPILGVQAANNYPGQVLLLIRTLEEFGHSDNPKPTTGISAQLEPIPIREIQEDIRLPSPLVKSVFENQGCSKVEFSPVYSYMLGKINSQKEAPRILEIGIGTNKKGMVSAMDKSYLPGASLRSYKQLLENALIFGVDFDPSSLFSEERIETAFGDQTRLETLLKLKREFGSVFDLVIDDGLHSTEANLNTLIFGLTVIAEEGIIYIEDISPKAIQVWQLVQIIMRRYSFETKIIQQNSSGISFLVEKN